jgi:hypothetical protein
MPPETFQSSSNLSNGSMTREVAFIRVPIDLSHPTSNPVDSTTVQMWTEEQRVAAAQAHTAVDLEHLEDVVILLFI